MNHDGGGALSALSLQARFPLKRGAPPKTRSPFYVME